MFKRYKILKGRAGKSDLIRVFAAFMAFVLVCASGMLTETPLTGNVKTAYAAEEHVHTAECYPEGAVCHTAHSDEEGCYGQVGRQVPCGGIFENERYVGGEYKCYTQYYFCANRQCPKHATATERTQGLNWQWWTRRYTYNGQNFYDDDYWSVPTCPACDRKLTHGYTVTDTFNGVYEYTCSGCGAKKYSVPNTVINSAKIKVENSVHDTKTVYERAITCTRTLGKYYIKNADGSYTEAEPICGKIAHTHTADCLAGTLHTAHTKADGCYKDVSVQRYCSGTWQHLSWEEHKAVKYYREYECRYCGSTTYWTEQISIMGSSLSYFCEGGDRSCYCKGRRTTSNKLSSSERSEFTEDIEKLRCSSCGATCLSWSDDEDCPKRYDTHGYRYVTEEQFCCTRELGKYYVHNADGSYSEGGCVCDKVITSLIPTKTKYVMSGDAAVAITAHAVFLDGHEDDISCWYKTGTGSGEFNLNNENTWQTVTVYADTTYPYADRGSNKTPKTATVQIMKSTKFNVTFGDCTNGTIMFETPGDDGFAPGETVKVSIIPAEGYYAKIVSETGITNDSAETRLITDVLSTTSYVQGAGYTSGTFELASTGNVTKATFTFSMPPNAVEFRTTFLPMEFDVVFDPNGGEWRGSSDPKVGKVRYDNAYSTTAGYPQNPTYADHVFAGWFTAPDDTGRRLSLSDIHSTLGSVTYYAHWLDIVREEMTTQEYDNVVYYPTPVPIIGFSYDTATFWRVSEDRKNGAGDHLEQGSVVTDLEDRTYYGHWKADHYRLTLNANGGFFDRTEVESTRDASSAGYMTYANANQAIKEVVYHMPYGELPTPTRSGYTFLGWKLPGGTNLTEMVTMAENLTLTAAWEEGTLPEPSSRAFAVTNLDIIDAGGVYDPTAAIPSTEVLIAKGKLSPWDFRISYTVSGGLTKISKMTVYGVQGISWHIEDSDGRSCLDLSVPNYTDMGSVLTLEKNVSGALGCTIYMTSDYVDDDPTNGVTGCGVKIVRYTDATKNDEIYIDGKKVTLTSDEICPSSTFAFRTELPLLWSALNGTYSVSYTLTYELFLNE